VANYRWGARAEVFATVQNVLDDAYLVSLAPAGARPGMPRLLQGGMRFRF
jgi:Fe(3+) dicitrate transport protein